MIRQAGRLARWMSVVAVVMVAVSVASADPLKEDYQSYILNFVGGTPTSSGVYDAQDNYDPTGGKTIGVAKTKPAKVEYIKTFSLEYYNILESEYKVADGWSYATRVADLTDDSLLVRTYDVNGAPGHVGVEFHLEYIAGQGDPTQNLHWIQVIKDNHAIDDSNNDQGHGTAEAEVDNPYSLNARSPYYDDGGAAVFSATGGDFYDFPGRLDDDKNHDWVAELMLVTGPGLVGNSANPGLITFLGGVRWGWENTAVPEPATMVLLAGGAMALLHRRRAA